MKFKLSVLLIILSTLSCYKIERNCLDYHTGIFEFNSVIKGDSITSRFKRTENFEIEFYNGEIDSSRIKWLSPCEFIVTKIKPISNQDKKPINIRILSTGSNSYNFEYHMVGNRKNIKRGTVKKLKDSVLLN